MKRIRVPKVLLLAYTTLHWEGVKKMLKHFGVEDIAPYEKHESEAEALIELAGRMCYRSFEVGLQPNISKIRKDSKKYSNNILVSKHGSVLEHPVLTFAFLNVSRVFTHELVRHRAGIAISQESLRFVRLTEISAWLPKILNPVEEEMVETIMFLEEQQKKMQKKFDWDNMRFSEKKKVTSALRRALPIGLATNIIWSANARALRWIVEMRTSQHAEVEIREVFGRVGYICKQALPLTFQDFDAVDLDDGTLSWQPTYSKV